MSNNTITRTIYPLDYTGTATSNRVVNEAVTLPSQTYRAFSPVFAPYFGSSIQITDLATSQLLTNTQYQLYNLVAAPSAIGGVGKEVYSAVIILDSAVSANLQITYQTVGGNYCVGYDSLVTLVNNLINNQRPIGWQNLTNLPSGFSENFHLHSLGSTVGWEFLSSELEQLRNVLMLGDQVKKDFILTYIDSAVAALSLSQASLTTSGTPFALHVASTSNPHGVTPAQIGLGNVQNYALATDAQAYAGLATNLYVTAAQAAHMVQNAINLGIDAHILRVDNPHAVTAAQVGLGSVLNYAPAVLSDLQTPVAGSPKYVTNVVLGNYLTTYFTTQATNYANSFATLTTTANNALTTSNTSLTNANAALTAANAAVAAISNAVTSAATALAAANANVTAANGAATAAQNLLNTYTVSAVSTSYTSGYNAGYAAGHAAALAGN
jgi:hypothetical protein